MGVHFQHAPTIIAVFISTAMIGGLRMVHTQIIIIAMVDFRIVILVMMSLRVQGISLSDGKKVYIEVHVALNHSSSGACTVHIDLPSP